MRRREFLLAAAQASAGGDDFIRVSRRDARYLETGAGKPYIPIGLNLIAPPRAQNESEAWAAFERWLGRLYENSGNYIRLWLSNPFWAVEHEREGLYDESRAKRIERALDFCRKRSIKVKMTLEHFRTIGEPTKQPWADKPLHNKTNGGSALSTADFFDGEAPRAQFKKKIGWFAKRFGDDPAVFAWELWNEVNAVRGGNILAWTEVMLKELHARFPRNLAVQSLGSFDRERTRDIYRRHSLLPGNDLAQVHRYLDLGAEWEVCHGPVDVLAAEAVRELLSYKPQRSVLLAESGAVEPKHTGPFKLYAKDKEGIILHDVLFAPFFAGAAGPGQIWHWDSYVDANDLWWHFGRFSAVVEDLDPPAERFQPSMLEHDALRIYSLAGNNTTLLWCRDRENSWRSELEQERSPSTLRGLEIRGFGDARSARLFDPWAGRWQALERPNGVLRIPQLKRSAVVRLENALRA
jgi:hypothetical protein